MSDQILTKRALATAIGRHHSTVLSWLESKDWPFAPRAPWPASLLPEIRKWAATRPPSGFTAANWKRRQEKLAAAATANQQSEINRPETPNDIRHKVHAAHAEFTAWTQGFAGSLQSLITALEDAGGQPDPRIDALRNRVINVLPIYREVGRLISQAANQQIDSITREQLTRSQQCN